MEKKVCAKCEAKRPASVDNCWNCGSTDFTATDEAIQKRESIIEPNIAIIVGVPPKVYSAPSLNDEIPVTLNHDDQIQLIEPEGNAVKIELTDGSTGYIDGDEELHIIQKSWLNAKKAEIYDSPSEHSDIIETWEKGEEFDVLNVLEGDKWIRIRKDGKIGYLDGKIKIVTTESLAEAIGESMGNGLDKEAIVRTYLKEGVPAQTIRDVYSEISAAVAEYETSGEGRKDLASKYARHMISGLLWAVGGIIVTAATYEAASDGGTYVIAWGAIIFGIVDFFRGLFGWMQYRS